MGAASSSQRVYRGGAWNDFAKNLRSAYRAAMQPDAAAFNVGIRLVRNAEESEGIAVAAERQRYHASVTE